MIKKAVSAIALSALMLVSGRVVWADSIDYTEPAIENGTLSVKGKINSDVSGTKKLNYVVIKEGDSKGIYACEEIETDASGVFDFVVEFPNADDGDTVGYTLTTGKYQLRMSSDNCDVKEFLFDFVNTADAIRAIRQCSSIDDFNKLMKDNTEQLEFIGFDASLYTDKLSSDEKNEVYEGMIAECNLKTDKIDDILKAFNKNSLYRFVNVGAENALNKLNPSFEDKNYSDITDASLKSIVKTFVYSNKNYTSNEDVEKMYEKVNIIYLFRQGNTDDFDGLLKKYNDKIELTSADYKKYTDLSEKKKTYVRSTVLTDMREKNSFDYKYFVKALNNAVENAPDDNKNTGGSGNGGKGGASVSGKSTGNTIVNVGVIGNENTDSPESSAFTDIDEYDWAKDAINTLYRKNIISGIGDGKFAPENYVTREEIVKMILGLFEISPINETTVFADVDSLQWYSGYISAASKMGIVTGISEDEFGVGRYVSRQDIAVMIKRAVELTNKYSIKKIKNDAEFSDKETIAEYAISAINDLACAGIINGFEDGSFKPDNNCTRAEAAQMLYKLIK